MMVGIMILMVPCDGQCDTDDDNDEAADDVDSDEIMNLHVR